MLALLTLVGTTIVQANSPLKGQSKTDFLSFKLTWATPSIVTNGIKYFQSWLRFNQVFRIFKSKKIDSPGYQILRRLTHWWVSHSGKSISPG